MAQANSSTGRPRRLGRGLSALVGTDAPVRVEPQAGTTNHHWATSRPSVPSSEAPAQDEGPGGFRWIPLADVEPNRYQPRQSFEDSGLEALADSIRRSGVMQPVAVRAGSAPGRFELIAGERRWRAAKAAGVASIPAVVHELSDLEAAEWALVENIQREDLNPIDRARAFRRLGEEFGLSQQGIAERVSLDRSSVANLLRLLDLEEDLQSLIASGELSAGHAKALLAAPSGEARVALGRRAVGESWSVRRTEREASGSGKGGGGGSGSAASERSDSRGAALVDLERRLGEHLGTRVLLKTDGSGRRGRITIEFYDLDHFDGLMSKLGFSAETV